MVIAEIGAALQAQHRANAAIKAGSHAAMVSMSNSPITDTPEAAQQRYDRLVASTNTLQADLADLTTYLAIQLGPQVYKGTLVLGKIEQPRLGKDPVKYLSYEAMTMASLLEVIHRARAIAHVTGSVCTAPDVAQQKQIAELVEPWHSRPIDYAFLVQALRDIGLWDSIAGAKGPSGKTLTATANSSMAQALRMGRISDVGEFDSDEAARILTNLPNFARWRPDNLGGPLPDRDSAARTIYRRILSAAPDARGPIVRELHARKSLGPLCDNLPRRDVENLHDGIKRFDPEAARMLAPYFEGKGDGESLHQLYMNAVDSRLAKGQPIRAYGWFALDAIHDGLTGGFERGYSEAYDAHEQGVTTDDQFSAAAAKQLGRAGALTAATAATGGVVGAWGEGVAAGLGAGSKLAQVAGGTIGGAASGVSGQFAADVYDQTVLDKDGFSSAKDYALSAAIGAGTGLVTAGIQPTGAPRNPQKPPPRAVAKYMAETGETMRQAYGKQYPGLDNLLTKIRNAGIRQGLVIRVTRQELGLLKKLAKTSPLAASEPLDRIYKVVDNERIDIQSRTLSKVHPQSEIQQYYGNVDPTTGNVNVLNKNPTSAGFVADAEHFAGTTRTTNAEVREVLGIDVDPKLQPKNEYQKYRNGNDPLFEVTFNVTTELDVPLPQEAAKGTLLGEKDAQFHHVAGAGKTQGGIPEGKLPTGALIEIVAIRPVGTPRASYPVVPGSPYNPFSPAQPSVRKLSAPLSGTTSGIGAMAISRNVGDDDEHPNERAASLSSDTSAEATEAKARSLHDEDGDD